MPSSQAPAFFACGNRHPLLVLLTFVSSVVLAVLGATSTAYAEGEIPEKPEDLIHVTEGAEVSAPDLDSITSLMNGLNSAHEEQVGILITDADENPQDLSDRALEDWGLSENGAVIVITTQDQGVGLSVGSSLTDRVTPQDQEDVVNKVIEGVGQYNDWGSGVRSGATRLFLYIEDQGLGGGTDGEHSEPGHQHEPNDPAVEEVPSGQAPDDAYVEDDPQAGGQSADDGFSDKTKVVFGSVIVVLSAACLSLLVRGMRRRLQRAMEEEESSVNDEEERDKE